jgi:hypothetical protein
MEQARYLRRHADWFLDMAIRSGNGGMFEKLLTLAATYQQKALDAEHGINRASMAVQRAAANAPHHAKAS